MLLTRDDGVVAKSPVDVSQLEAAGYVKCLTSSMSARGKSGQSCPFFLSPETQSEVEGKGGGYYTCPVCYHSHDLLHELPWHGVTDEDVINRNQLSDQSANQWKAGGGTRIGVTMRTQGQQGEDLVQSMGEIPGYGPITWWASDYNSPLDGATDDWGIEVKTVGYDAMHHRFIPGGKKTIQEKVSHAQRMGKKGILGVLVLLDYRRSVADIFVKPCTTEEGLKSFRSNQMNIDHIAKEIPFKNPLMDPASPEPQVGGHSAFTDEEGNELF